MVPERFSALFDNPERDAEEARRFGERSVELDPLDPFANFAMGRTFWLRGDVEDSWPWLDRSTALCPNYAQGFYARAWADTIAERDQAGTENVSIALSLSPLDPFRYAMLATRALDYLIQGDTEQAAVWADKAARSPGAHVLILLIAVIAHALNNNRHRAAAWCAQVRSRRPDTHAGALLQLVSVQRWDATTSHVEGAIGVRLLRGRSIVRCKRRSNFGVPAIADVSQSGARRGTPRCG